MRPWIGLKMLDLNDMIVAQLKEKDVMFPDVTRGVLVPMVCFVPIADTGLSTKDLSRFFKMIKVLNMISKTIQLEYKFTFGDFRRV